MNQEIADAIQSAAQDVYVATDFLQSAYQRLVNAMEADPDWRESFELTIGYLSNEVRSLERVAKRMEEV